MIGTKRPKKGVGEIEVCDLSASYFASPTIKFVNLLDALDNIKMS